MSECRIRRYSAFDNYTFVSEGENHSNVIDHLLRITTKQTEKYASDILYVIHAFEKAVDKQTHLRMVIGFRENGVEAKYMETDDPELVQSPWSNASRPEFHQFWLLEYLPGEGSSLVRVEVTGQDAN